MKWGETIKKRFRRSRGADRTAHARRVHATVCQLSDDHAAVALSPELLGRRDRIRLSEFEFGEWLAAASHTHERLRKRHGQHLKTWL